MFLLHYPVVNNDQNRKDRHSITMRVRRHNHTVRLNRVFKKTYIG